MKWVGAQQKTLIKWQKISYSQLTRISERLSLMQRYPPNSVPELLNFGLTVENSVRLCFQRVLGQNLNSCMHNLCLHEKKWIIDTLQKQISQWKNQDFVHGDLSLRNILYDNTNNQLWFIDWILDLKSFSGTPYFASKEVFKGIHTYESDAFAMMRICDMLLA